MRYGFLTFGALNNAGYIRARELGRALLDCGVEVAYIAADLPENRGVLDARADIRFVKHGHSPACFIERRRAIRSLNLDYLEVFNDQNGQTWLTLLGLRLPKLVGMWDEAAIFKDELPWVKRKLISYWDGWFRRHATLRLTSTREHQRLWALAHAEPIVYMPHACYLSHYSEGISPYKQKTAVYMGIFYSCWDQDLIFDAFLLLKQQGLTPSLCLIGTGPDVPKWQAFIREHGLDNITFAGYISGESLWQHLRHAQVLLFPMRPTLLNKTRCPSKTLAYAQARRPVVTCKVGEVAEMLGDKAIYVEPTPEGFAGGIRHAMENQSLPDVEYDLEQHTWAKRAADLLLELKRV